MLLLLLQAEHFAPPDPMDCNTSLHSLGICVLNGGIEARVGEVSGLPLIFAPGHRVVRKLRRRAKGCVADFVARGWQARCCACWRTTRRRSRTRPVQPQLLRTSITTCMCYPDRVEGPHFVPGLPHVGTLAGRGCRRQVHQLRRHHLRAARARRRPCGHGRGSSSPKLASWSLRHELLTPTAIELGEP